MKNSKIKLFIMFLAGILFSSLAVFAATISIPSNFTNAVQYLNKLVVTDNNNITGVILDGANQKIWVNQICDEEGENCTYVADLGQGYGSAPDLSEYFEGENGMWCKMFQNKIRCTYSTPGGGGSIVLGNGDVKENHIDTNAVTTNKIKDSNVTSGKIANNAVTVSKIENYAVSSIKIQTGAVTSDKIANNAVTVSKIENYAVSSIKIQTGAVTTAKIANNAVTQDQVKDGYITPNTTQTITGLKKFEREIEILRAGFLDYIRFRNLTGDGSTSDNYWHIRNASHDTNFINSGNFSLELRHNLVVDRPLLSFGYFSGGTNIKSSMGILDYASENYALTVSGATRIKGYLKIDAGDVDILGGVLTVKTGEARFDNTYLELKSGEAHIYKSNVSMLQSNVSMLQSNVEIEKGTIKILSGSSWLNIDENGIVAKNDITNRATGSIKSFIGSNEIHAISNSGITITNSTSTFSEPALTVKRGQGTTGILATFEGNNAGKLNFEARNDSHIIALREKSKHLELGTTTSTGLWNDNQLFLHSGGNVGIGTDAPKAKLDVNGGIKINGSTGDICDEFTEGTLIYAKTGNAKGVYVCFGIDSEYFRRHKIYP